MRWGRRCGIREFTVPVAGCRVPRRKPPLTLTRSGKPSPCTAPVRSAISSCCATSGWTWAEIRHCPCRPIGVAPPWQGGAAGASEGLRRATIHQIANESLPAVVRSPRLPKLPRADNDLASNCPEFCKFLDRQRSRKRVLPVDAISVCRKTPFLEFEPASAVKFDPDLTGGFRVKWTWSATFGGKRRAGGDFGAHIGDFWKYRAWRAAGSPVRAALARFPGDVRQLFVAGT